MPAPIFFVGTLILLWLVHRIPEINTFLVSSFQIKVVDGISISIFAAILALVIAIISRIIKLHDKISDLFNIRINFDTKYILTPMLTGVQLPVNETVNKGLRDKRSELMNDVFYAYASSTKEKCKIDFHHVTIALDQWSWVWIMTEAAFLFALGSIASFLLEDGYPGSLMATISAALWAFAYFNREKFCSKYARIEIDEILKDPVRRTEVTNRLTSFVNAL